MWGTAALGFPAATVSVAAAAIYTPAPVIIATSGAPMRNLFLALCLVFATSLANAQQYDLVLEGG